ncbi:MAG: hypothetical protein ABSG31_08760 [Tepidisphaeraceae bacterium]
MTPQIPALSEKDKRLLTSIQAGELSQEMAVLGRFIMAFGWMMIFTWIVVFVVLRSGASGSVLYLLYTGVIILMVGGQSVRDFRYKRIMKHLLDLQRQNPCPPPLV